MNRRETPYCSTVAWLILAAMLASVTASNNASAAESASDTDILTRLGSDDYKTREAATYELLAQELPDTSQLSRLYHEAKLPEQRHRLRQVIEHQVMAKIIDERFPRPAGGAIGLRQMEVPQGQLPELGRRAIRVESTMPGFPGFVHLRAGDLIVAVDGKEITAPQDQPLAQRFTEMVKGRQAGDFISLTVLRDGKKQTERFQLSNSNALAQLYGATTVPFNTQALVFAQRRRELMRLMGDDDADVTQFQVDLPQPKDDPDADNDNQQGRAPIWMVPGNSPSVFALYPVGRIGNQAQVLDRIDQILNEIEALPLVPEDQLATP